MFNKPKFMTMVDWIEFRQLHTDTDGLMHCVGYSKPCGKTEKEARMTVDHKVPRSRQGQDVLSNYQPLCLSCNCKKYNFPDRLLAGNLYFDGYLNTDRLRASQSDFVMSPIKETAFFWSQPFSNINGKLFLICQVVGAGKTIGMFSLPFAINNAINENDIKMGVRSPRIVKMLIITKNQSLRQQIVGELRTEPQRYGIINENPIVKEITSNEDLINFNDEHHIAVMCPNLLWPDWDETDGGGGTEAIWHPRIENILSHYQLICNDETHFAYRKVKELLRVARNSLVFGFTASPIKANGDLLEDMVRISNFSYDDAQINDGSMKQINLYTHDPEVGSEAEALNSLTLVKTMNQKFIGEVDPALGNTTIGQPNIKSVVDAAIQKVHSLDNPDGYGAKTFYEKRWQKYLASEHKTITIGAQYPSHCIIVASRKEAAEDIATYINKVFDSDPVRYPRDKGYKALAAFGGSAIPFDEKHPFFYYKNKKIINSVACRFLVVVDLAIEGMNNAYANVLGITCPSSSINNIVQRLGRLLRVVKVEDDYEIKVSPRSHDTLYCLVHEDDANTIATTRAALEFILDGSENLQGIMSLEDYIEIDDPSIDEDPELNAVFDRWQYWKMAMGVGKAKLSGKRVSSERILKTVAGIGDKKYRRRRAQEFIDGISIHDEEEMERLYSIFKMDLPKPITHVLIEEERDAGLMNEEQANEWLKSEGLETLIDTNTLEQKNAIRQKICASYGRVAFETSTAPHEVMKQLRNDIAAKLDYNFHPYFDEYFVHMFSVIQPGATIADFDLGGSLSASWVAFQIRDETFVSNLQAWLRFKTVDEGFAPEVAQVLGNAGIKGGSV